MAPVTNTVEIVDDAPIEPGPNVNQIGWGVCVVVLAMLAITVMIAVQRRR